MYLKRNKFYKHRNFIDVCFFVNKSQYFISPYTHHTHVVLKISWYLLKNLTPMMLHETIKLTGKQLENYKEIPNE